MGLLGGFKANFRGNRRQVRKTNIVCVKFNSLSPEFDPPSSALPSCSNANPGRNDVIKEKRTPVKPEIKGLFPTNGDATKVQDGPSPPPKQPAPQPVPQRKAEDKPHFTSHRPELKKEAPKVPTPLPIKAEDKPHFTSNRPTATTSEMKKQAPKVPTPLPESKVATPKEETSSNSEDDEYFKIQFTENRSATKPETRKEEETLFNHEDEEDDGNFKIHFVQNGQRQSGNLSDDQHSEEEDDIDFGPVNYSSQASSIFFGEEDEPIIMRPRNFAVKDDDNDSEGSSASA